MAEEIREKATRAWLKQSEIEVLSKNGKVHRGHITEVCGGFFRASYDGESELHVPQYGNVADIVFLDEEVAPITQRVIGQMFELLQKALCSGGEVSVRYKSFSEELFWH